MDSIDAWIVEHLISIVDFTPHEDKFPSVSERLEKIRGLKFSNYKFLKFFIETHYPIKIQENAPGDCSYLQSHFSLETGWTDLVIGMHSERISGPKDACLFTLLHELGHFLIWDHQRACWYGCYHTIGKEHCNLTEIEFLIEEEERAWAAGRRYVAEEMLDAYDAHAQKMLWNFTSWRAHKVN